MSSETAQVAISFTLSGDKLYQKRARKTLPYLVRQAKSKKTIYYSDLAGEIGIKNPRNLNYILGAIGKTLIELGQKHGIEIPPIQCIVINKATELPGEGIGWFIKREDFNKDFHKLTRSEKKEAINMQLTRIFAFQRWDWVLKELNLEPIRINTKRQILDAKAYNSSVAESESHKLLKQFIAENPTSVGLKKKVGVGIQEYLLPSSDKIDVVFNDSGLRIGVEVKAKVSNNADITRGLFQCVKYKYLIEAEQIVNGERPNSRIILALENPFPVELIQVKNMLGIEVVDAIEINS